MKRTNGFTIIELLVTLAVAALLATVAAPSFSAFIRDGRMTSAANSLVVELNTARSESVKRGTRINLSAVSGNTDWSAGWTIYEDSDADGVQDAGEANIQVGDGTDAPLTITGDAAFISYQPAGTLTVAPATRTLTLCESDRAGETGRQITISATGRVNMADFVCP
jgi:type IV fimbrial biogenesis protein FimT